MHPIHNLQLDPICLDLYDFLTEIRSLLAVPRGSRPLEIADGSVFFCRQAADEMRPLDRFFLARLGLCLLSLTNQKICNL
jgi:hypothetical protein